MRKDGEGESYLDITCPSIKVQVDIFYLSILCKLVRDVLFGSFLVDVCDHYNPPLDGWEMRLFRVAYGSGGGRRRTSCSPSLGCGFHTVKLLISSDTALVTTWEVGVKKSKKEHAARQSIPEL